MGMVATLREVQPGDLERMHDIHEVIELFGDAESPTLGLEKVWGGLSELLTAAGTAPELGFLWRGGRDVGALLS